MPKQVRKFFILLIGLTVLFIGTLMIFLPGPAFIVIPAGLAILASEFLWAKKILEKMKGKTKQIADQLHLKKKKTA